MNVHRQAAIIVSEDDLEHGIFQRGCNEIRRRLFERAHSVKIASGTQTRICGGAAVLGVTRCKFSVPKLPRRQ